jgi:hypothetical protein
MSATERKIMAINFPVGIYIYTWIKKYPPYYPHSGFFYLAKEIFLSVLQDPRVGQKTEVPSRDQYTLLARMRTGTKSYSNRILNDFTVIIKNIHEICTNIDKFTRISI